MMERRYKTIVKNFAVLVMGIMLLMSGYSSIARASDDFVYQIQAEPGEKVYIVDEADLLSESEREELSDKAGQLDEQYHLSVVILTTEEENESEIDDWTRDVYSQMQANGMVEDSGIVFAVNMAQRDWAVVGMGDANKAFTTYGRERIGSMISSSLSDEEYYQGFEKFQSLSEEFLAEAEKGEAFSEDHPYKESVSMVLIVVGSFVLSLIVSMCIVLAWKKSMNTRIKRDGATEYMKKESFVLARKSDRYLYRTVSRSRKESSNKSSGSMHSDSTGTSGKF